LSSLRYAQTECQLTVATQRFVGHPEQLVEAVAKRGPKWRTRRPGKQRNFEGTAPPHESESPVADLDAISEATSAAFFFFTYHKFFLSIDKKKSKNLNRFVLFDSLGFREMSTTKRNELMWRAERDDGTAGSSSAGAESSSSKSSRKKREARERDVVGSHSRVDDIRTRVDCRFEAPLNTETFDSTTSLMGTSSRFDADEFRRNLRVDVVSIDDEEAVFDVRGIEAPMANALRRILLEEIPSMAIEKVWISANSSLIQDEVLAHRLGLVPLAADPREFECCVNENPTDMDTLVFKLSVSCPADVKRKNVYTSDLVWQPQGGQSGKEINARPVHDNILLAVLGAGQRIELVAHAHLGTGKDHAKFSPVATASYRLLPEVTIRDPERPYVDDEADWLVKTCPMGVFDIEDAVDAGHERRAYVRRPRNCTLCRECIREPEHRERIRLSRVKNHFIYTVESVGAIPAKELFREAIKVLMSKCDEFCLQLDTTLRQDQSESSSSSSSSSMAAVDD
jgi:DNA-directed RNA polymerases I and III subunit RPAC1